jgi:hypothetical protein
MAKAATPTWPDVRRKLRWWLALELLDRAFRLASPEASRATVAAFADLKQSMKTDTGPRGQPEFRKRP